MIRVECPSGCPGWVKRPWRMRSEPVRCGNCTAWFRAPAGTEDGALTGGELVAEPGGKPAAAPSRRAARAVFRGERRGGGGRGRAVWVAAHLAVVAGVAVAAVTGGAAATLAAAVVAYAVGAARPRGSRA